MSSGVHRSDRSRSPVWPVRVLALFICWWAPVWPVVVTGLTGQSWADAVALFSSSGLHEFVQGELHWFRGSLHVCRGSSLWFFEFWFGGLRSLLELCFVSDVLSRCPCLRGPRLVFLKWSCSLPLFGFRSLVGGSFIACWRFFLFVSFLFLFSLVTLCGCCQSTYQGGDWGPCVVRGPVDGRFLVWWVIDNVVWTDSRLSIAGAGCGLTRVGAGEEQARKVVAGEASRCGEDK
jgi:hypothetical protein